MSLTTAFQYQDSEAQRLNILPTITGPQVSCIPTPDSVSGTQWQFNKYLSNEQQYHNDITAEIPVQIF